MGFPDSSVGKESVCNAGDLGLILESERSSGEGIGYPPHYAWPSLVAQTGKESAHNMGDWNLSLGWEDLLEKGKATHSIILAGEFHGLYSPGTFTFTFLTSLRADRCDSLYLDSLYNQYSVC